MGTMRLYDTGIYASVEQMIEYIESYRTRNRGFAIQIYQYRIVPQEVLNLPHFEEATLEWYTTGYKEEKEALLKAYMDRPKWVKQLYGYQVDYSCDRHYTPVNCAWGLNYDFDKFIDFEGRSGGWAVLNYPSGGPRYTPEQFDEVKHRIDDITEYYHAVRSFAVLCEYFIHAYITYVENFNRDGSDD